MSKRIGRLVVTVVLTAACGAMAEEEYLPGGPLAGLKLPPFPTHAGEEPGYPGCIPELAAQGKEIQDMGNTYREFGPQGQPPQIGLHSGSIENWHTCG